MKLIKSLVFALSCLPLLAQYADPEMDDLLNEMLFAKTETRQQLIHRFRLCFPEDSTGVMQAYKIIGDHGRRHGDVLLELCEPSGYLMLARLSPTITNERQKAVIDSVYGIYKSKKVSPVFYSSMERHIGNYYLHKEKNYALAFDYYQRSIDLLKDVDPKQYPYKLNENLNLINLRIDFNDFEEAIALGREVMPYFDQVKQQRRASEFLFQISQSHRALGQLDSSDVYLLRLIAESDNPNAMVTAGTARCYLGFNEQLRGHLTEANELFQQGLLELSAKDLDVSTRIVASSFLAINDLEAAQLANAEKRLEACMNLGPHKVFDKEKPIVYRNIAKVFKELGQADLALRYLDSVDMAEKYLQEKYDTPRFIRAQQDQKLRMAETEKANIVFWRNTSLIGISFLFVISLLYYWLSYRRKTIELSNIQAELEHSRDQLQRIIQLSKQRASGESLTSYQAGSHVAVESLEAATILTKEDWQNFKRHFEVVYPGFLDHLTDSLADLTTSEIRYLTLKKMDLTNDEMANMLGVSESSIRTTLYRIRKKRGIPLPSDIAELLDK